MQWLRSYYRHDRMHMDQMAGRDPEYKPRFVGLPNILFGNDLAPELLGPDPQPAALIDAIELLLDDRAEADRQRAGFARVRAGMEKGAPEAPLVDAVDRVLANLPQRFVSGT